MNLVTQVDEKEIAFSLGVLDITIIGALVIPSRSCRMEGLARGTVIDVFEDLVGDEPPLPLCRKPREYYEEYRLRQLERLRARIE